MKRTIFFMICTLVQIISCEKDAGKTDHSGLNADTLNREKRSFFDLFFGTTTTRKPATLGPNSVCSCSERIVKRETGDDDENDLFRIVGGTASKPHEYPQVCELRYSNKMCGCTIINKEHILTAAHCVDESSQGSAYQIVVGKHDLAKKEPNEKIVRAKKITKHPKYNSQTFSYDIAIVTLSSPLTFNQDVKPSCLPLSQRNYDGKTATAVGWGKTSESSKSVAQIQQKVDVRVIPSNECRNYYSGRHVIDYSMLCAGYPEGGKDSCGGDSGGPLFLKSSQTPPVQIGITSFGYGCARKGYPGVYDDVGKNINFIIANTQTNTGCQIYSHDRP